MDNVLYRYESSAEEHPRNTCDILVYEISELGNTGSLRILGQMLRSDSIGQRLMYLADQMEADTELEDGDLSLVRYLIREALQLVSQNTGELCEFAIWLADLETVVKTYVELGRGRLMGYQCSSLILDTVEESVGLYAYAEIPSPIIEIDLESEQYNSCTSLAKLLKLLSMELNSAADEITTEFSDLPQ